MAAYTGWTLLFFVGVGAFNGVWNWGFARQEPTEHQELAMAGYKQGLWRYFRYTTDHKVVGMQYLATVLFIFFIGSMGAFMIRLQQSVPGSIFFTPSTYNTIVGMHGILMIVASIVMISGPFGNFVLPIMIGARDMAFPRLNALSYWLLFSAVPVFFSTLFLGGFPTGWTGYAPLSVQAFTTGMDAYGDGVASKRHDMGTSAGIRLGRIAFSIPRFNSVPFVLAVTGDGLDGQSVPNLLLHCRVRR